jgi:D-alanyl-D-alanine carboxypeptidase/D-alanyl-D-alanine-endopeptidase (penicillin-binding protein 4)
MGYMRRMSRWLLSLALFAVTAITSAADSLGPLAAPVQRYKVPVTNISVWVQAVDAKTPLLTLNTEVARNPASTMKLVTTFVALDTLGPTHTWKTEFYSLGTITNGVLQGDLLLKGYGDPYLVESDVWKMLGELKGSGITHITGDLILDDSHFSPTSRDPGAFDGERYRLYNVSPSAVMVNFKAVNFFFAPGTDGHTVQIRTEPELPNLKITNLLRLTKGRCRGVLSSFNMSVPDPVAADEVVFDGNYQATCGEQSLPRTLLQPDTYLYGMFREYWKLWGGTFDGTLKHGVMPANQRPHYVWESPPLADVIRPLNKWSNNVMADALLYALADSLFEPPLSLAQGASVVQSYLGQHDIPHEGFVMENGSGLSRSSRISAHTMSSLLLHAYHSRFMPEYIASLSLVGLDGTFRRRFRHSPEVGTMHLKSGHLDDVTAAAGYVQARSGKTYVVVFFLNGVPWPGDALINVLLRWVYQQ